MDLATIEPALLGWAAAITGVESTCVLWENAPRVRSNTALVLLSWVSIVGVGTDETSWAYAENVDPLQEMTATVAGPRTCVLQLSVETYDQRPGYTARAIAETARTRARGPRSEAALLAAGLGLAGVGDVRNADYRVDQRWIARTVMECRLNAESRVVDGTTSYIATVEAELTLAGTATEEGYGPTEITIP